MLSIEPSNTTLRKSNALEFYSFLRVYKKLSGTVDHGLPKFCRRAEASGGPKAAALLVEERIPYIRWTPLSVRALRNGPGKDIRKEQLRWITSVAPLMTSTLRLTPPDDLMTASEVPCANRITPIYRNSSDCLKFYSFLRVYKKHKGTEDHGLPKFCRRAEASGGPPFDGHPKRSALREPNHTNLQELFWLVQPFREEGQVRYLYGGHFCQNECSNGRNQSKQEPQGFQWIAQSITTITCFPKDLESISSTENGSEFVHYERPTPKQQIILQAPRMFPSADMLQSVELLSSHAERLTEIEDFLRKQDKERECA
uniref:Uncharacterized protein n=1 Tax=Steinernema glaseri TaxID=37863 RepID=A0A1I7XZH6_9BILA